MGTPKTGYQSYLLRLWQESPGAEQRALLQDVLTGERRHFSNLDYLLAYLNTLKNGKNQESSSPKESSGEVS